jgi:Tfp pilus assembly protein PilN
MGAAFQLVLPEAVRVDAESEKLGDAPVEFLRRRLFKTGAMTLLTTVLAALLLNFFFFSQYRTEAAALEDRLQTEGGAFAEMQNLRAQLEGRRSFLQQAGLLGKAHYAWYADQLAKGMPVEIQLTQLRIAPRIKTAEEDTIGFRTGKLSLIGNCSESLVLNQWMKTIQEMSWIRTATLISYVQEKAMSKGEFEIEIELE